MIPRLPSVCVLAVVLASACQSMAADNPYAPNHRCTLDETRQLTLAVAGQPRAEIVVGDEAGKVAAFAAQEMQALLQKVTGAELPIVSQVSGRGTAIHLGDTALARRNGVDAAKLPRDAFVIKSVGKDIFIAGRDARDTDPRRGYYVWGILYERGTLFGVYDFLERFAGVRFFFPGDMGTVTPKQPTLRVPAIDVYEAPDFDTRGLRFNSDTLLPDGRRFGDDRWVWTRLHLRWRYSTLYIPCCHGLSRRGYLQRFGKSNPEYFALLPNGKRDSDPNIHGHRGHLDYLNEGFLNEVFLDAKAYLTGQPASSRGILAKGKVGYDPSSHQPGYVDLGPQDGLGEQSWDRSPESWKYWAEGRQADLIWGYVAKIARRLKEEGIPGNVTNFAYSCFRQVPSDEVDLPDNVYVQVCLRGPWDDTIPELKRRNDELIRGWNKKIKTGKVWLWNYMHDYNGHVPKGVPPVSTHLIANYYRRLAPHLRGSRSQGSNYYLLFNYLNNYTFYKVCWNTQTDAAALMRDHSEKLFGPAAGPMGEFFARVEDIWEHEALGEVRETDLGPIPIRKTQDEVWKRIYTEEVMAELKGLFAKARRLAAKDRTALARVEFYEEKFLGEIENQRKAYFDRVGDVRDLFCEAARISTKIAVDGKPDEAAWRDAKPVYLVPYDGGDPRVKTAARSVWTPDSLYVAFDCDEPRTKDMILDAEADGEKGMWKDASVEVFLSPSSDRKNYYHLMVNAKGLVTDSKVSRRGAKLQPEDIDWTWKSHVDVKTRILEDRWVAEMAIPVRSMGALAIGDRTSWVANLNRSRNIKTSDKADNQFLSWSPFLSRNFHDIHHFGSLRFVEKLTDPAEAIVRNGSFEELDKQGRMVDWHFQRGLTPETKARTSVDTTTYREGKQSIRIENGTLKRVIIGQIDLPGQGGQLETGKRYRLSFFIKGEDIKMLPNGSPKFHGAFVNVWSHRNFFFPPTKKYTGTFGWTKQAFVFTSMPPLKGVKKVPPDYIRFGLQDASGTVWVDDVRIEEVE